jgi:hypothetical protein
MNIIEIARQAGVRDDGHRFEFSELKYLEWFAALVAAHEREECAKIAENFLAALQRDRISIANAIRARSKA